MDTNSESIIAARAAIITDLKEQGYIEIIDDEDLWYKTELWFYGELMESDGKTILEYK